MHLLFNNLLLNIIKYFLRAYDKSHNYGRSLAFQAIRSTGAAFRDARRSVPSILPTSKRSRDPLGESQSRLHAPYRG
jgi:hypothetical protein